MQNLSQKKVPMPEQEPQIRARNFEEVTLGYTVEMALEEYLSKVAPTKKNKK